MDKLTREDIIALRPQLEKILPKYGGEWIVVWTDKHKRGVLAIELLLKIAVYENAVKGYTRVNLSSRTHHFSEMFDGRSLIDEAGKVDMNTVLHIFDFNPRLVSRLDNALPLMTWIWIDKNIGLTTCEKIFNELGI